ncbi:C-type mannose receptor 2-like [Gigantopelta aegis]|uniref:C-type mannose receptor 2-like n=1 Tax=Gigantopelta aegis TaxID=1735272 RepID=UPI001B88E68F|nr:C-type mannose receptor 2-like [Gigantopelta aegis]
MILGDMIRVGICYPKGVTSFEVTGSQLAMVTMFSVSSIKELDSDTTGKAWFWDSASGLLFIKLVGFHDSIDGEVCPGLRCPTITIIRNGGGSTPADCFDAAYTGAAPYKKQDTCSETVPSRKPCSKSETIPEGIGMPVVPSIENVPKFAPECSVPVIHPNRGSIEYMGCFRDTKIRDLPYDRWILMASMTPEVCIERCYYRGYQYAAVQIGNQCFCGNAYGIFGEDSGGCKKPCSGDSSKICGGMMKNSVYSTGNAADAALPTCGPGNSGVQINGNCFYLGGSPVDYVLGEKQCVGLGGHLAKIDSADTMTKLEMYLRPSKSDVWIGLSDVVTEGNFQWTDGSSLGAYNNFKTNVGKSDFVFLEVASVFHWQTAASIKAKRPLCKITGSAPTTSKCGTNDYGNRTGTSQACYAVLPDRATFREAQYACWTRNGRLAPITAASKNEVIQHIYLFGHSGVRDYWVQGSDSSVYTELRYGAVFNEGTAGLSTLNIPVCLLEDVSASNPCSTGWTLSNGYCYLYSNYKASSYADTLNLCKQGISDIVTIHSAAEHEFVINMVKSVSGRKSSVLLGFKYSSGSFRWADGQTTQVTYWKTGKGDGNTAKGKCAVLKIKSLKWFNVDCKRTKAGVVCKAPAAN